MAVDWKLTVEVLSALLTPVTAGIATYIAWQQWNTNKLKVRLDRYDRRLKIYEETRAVLVLATRKTNIELDALMEFWRNISEADFLFGPEIPGYLSQIYDRGIKLWHSNKEYESNRLDSGEHYDHGSIVKEMHDQTVWFSKQFEPAKALFMPYLNIGDKT